MKINSLVFFIFLFTGVSIAQKDAEALSRIETKRYDAMSKLDTNYLKFILAEQLVYTHSNGMVETKREFINSIISGKIVYKTIGIKEQKINIIQKTALITGVLNVKGALNGKEFDLDLRYTVVYIKFEDWKLVAWQSLKL